jgi:putative CocE/NonD family hydrolase
MATIVQEFPRAVRVIENDWVPTSDGTRLAAKIWLPQDAETEPVPAILEFLPYRKRDGTAVRDELLFPYLAGHGYAGVRVDLRGHGDSDGLPDDEYTAQEQADGIDVIAWIAEQPWCTGAVGMHGISWGGFNSLQIAALRPPALRAIITLCSTDDRYSDDVHYKGGLVSALDMLHWGTYMLLANGEPPDPAIAGDDRWRQLWLDRIDASTPLTEIWLEHQRRDAYWKHGSVIEDYSAITAAVYAVGGWQDGYTNAIPRLLAGLDAPRKGLIGPWGHTWPHAGSPEPAIGFLQECVRWWDHWLKDVDTGIMDEPMLRAYVQDSVRPSPTHRERPGRWVSAAGWPPPSAQTRTLHLGDGTLAAEPAPETERSIMGRQTCGFDSGAWCGEGETSDDPDDQRAEDGMSLVFDSAPLRADVHLLGFPRVVLPLRSDRTRAMVCVRLCEVFPDGASKLVTRQILNLCHRDSHEHPEPLEPGRLTAVTVELDAIGHVLAAGNRVRIAISPTYWPWAWPSPEPVTLTILCGGDARLELPELPATAGDDGPPFGGPEMAAPLAVERLADGVTARTIVRDVQAGRSELRFLWDSGGHVVYPHGMRELAENEAVYSIVEGDPLSAEVNCFQAIEYERGNHQVRVEAHGCMTCDAVSFTLEHRLEAREHGEVVRERTWSRSIPRDLV